MAGWMMVFSWDFGYMLDVRYAGSKIIQLGKGIMLEVS